MSQEVYVPDQDNGPHINPHKNKTCRFYDKVFVQIKQRQYNMLNTEL